MKNIAKKIVLSSGRIIPAIGIGMWYFGKDAGSFNSELDLLKSALDIGYRLFDTAESYGKGGAEEVLGEAVKDCRKNVFITTKVSPKSMRYEQIITACNKSLERLKTDYIDIYLLHWRTKQGHLEDVVEAFLDLKKDGKIKDFGVSYFDKHDLEDWLAIKGTEQTALNQDNYNLANLTAQKELLPFCQEQRIPLMAQAPCDILPPAKGFETLKNMAKTKGYKPCQLNLAWLLQQYGVGALVKAYDKDRLKDLFDAQKIALDSEDKSNLLNNFL